MSLSNFPNLEEMYGERAFAIASSYNKIVNIVRSNDKENNKICRSLQRKLAIEELVE